MASELDGDLELLPGGAPAGFALLVGTPVTTLSEWELGPLLPLTGLPPPPPAGGSAAGGPAQSCWAAVRLCLHVLLLEGMRTAPRAA